MAKSNKRISKAAIYIPIYLLVTVGSILWLYNSLSFSGDIPQAPPPPVQSAAAVDKTPEKKDATIEQCIANYKDALGGVFKVTPAAELAKAFNGLEAECKEGTCTAMSAVNSGTMTPAAFFQKAENQDACLKKMLKEALRYHKSAVSRGPVHAIFYNVGQSSLFRAQVDDMAGFLKKNVNPATDGLLIIARASKGISEVAQHDVDRNRAQNIIEKVKTKFSTTIPTEFVYFGVDPPQLTFERADELGISPGAFRNVNIGNADDPDFSMRLNQSVLVVPYPLGTNPFDLK